jgi:hypothetical protein
MNNEFGFVSSRSVVSWSQTAECCNHKFILLVNLINDYRFLRNCVPSDFDEPQFSSSCSSFKIRGGEVTRKMISVLH